jgi:hypothetical protein
MWAGFILGVSLYVGVLGGPIEENITKMKNKNVSTNYYFMLLLINERACPQFVLVRGHAHILFLFC